MFMEDGGATYFKLGCLFMHHVSTCYTRITNISNMADILTEVLHLNSTVGLTCNWRIRGNE